MASYKYFFDGDILRAVKQINSKTLKVYKLSILKKDIIFYNEADNIVKYAIYYNFNDIDTTATSEIMTNAKFKKLYRYPQYRCNIDDNVYIKQYMILNNILHWMKAGNNYYNVSDTNNPNNIYYIDEDDKDRHILNPLQDIHITAVMHN